MRAWIPPLALALSAACGSPASSVTGGTTSGSGGSDTSSGATSSSGTGGSGGGACKPWSDSGAACATATQCVTPTAACRCEGGALGCRGTENLEPLGFAGPALQPPDGACCEVEGMTCSGYSDCGPTCHCQGGAWSCQQDVMCEPFACPTGFSELMMLNHEPCQGHVGLACGTGGCGSASCVCTLDPDTGEPAWACNAVPC